MRATTEDPDRFRSAVRPDGAQERVAGAGDRPPRATPDAATDVTTRPTPKPGTARAGRPALVLYVLTSFLGSFLLFVIEPMAAKMLLPQLGGSPAVWNTAMVFFQAALLLGYAFAHVTLSRLGLRRQPWLQVVLIAAPLLVLPIALPAGWSPPPGANPAPWTLLALTVMVGAPFFMLSTASPTSQRWFSGTSHPHAADPYFLYAAGNVGSLLGLLAYPLVIEPRLGLADQSRAWAAVYVLWVLCTVACALVLRRRRPTAEPVTAAAAAVATAPDTLTAAAESEHPRTDPGEAAPPTPSAADRPIDWRRRVRWVYWAAVPSALLLGVTRHISSDIAAIPLLWVVPLSLYLLTFIVAFGRRPEGTVRVANRAFRLLVVPIALGFLGLISSIWLNLALHLTVFLAATMVAHGRLAADRPDARRLTEFYLWMSTGGVVGGILTALVAPVIFNTVLEYPLALVLAISILPREDGVVVHGDLRQRLRAACTVRNILLAASFVLLTVIAIVVRGTGTQDSLVLAIVISAIGVGGAYVVVKSPTAFALAIGFLLIVAIEFPSNPTSYQSRSFFGVHRVYADTDGRHVLLNGTTVHAMETWDGPNAHAPQAYFHRSGPMGQYFGTFRTDPTPKRIGIIGLGAGVIAAYAKPGDHITYYEIDPEVIRIATDPSLFTFVPESKATIDYSLGDGRLNLAASNQTYDILMIDAFSSDSIPLHLLTTQAIELYKRHLRPGGVMVFNISNRYFDLQPVLARLAQAQGLVGVIQDDKGLTDAQVAEGKFASTFALLAVQHDDLGPAGTDPRWVPIDDGREVALWTDDFTDLLTVLRR